jgi:hypothetical protein
MSTKRINDGSAQRAGSSPTSSELLRAYQHLARVDILEGALSGAAFCDVSTLAALALGELGAGRDREAADLLRAAEHISFAAQTPRGYASAMRIFDELRDAIGAEFDTRMRRAELFRRERSSPRHGVVPDICTRTLQLAREAYAEELLGRALELAHAVELLAEIALRSVMPEHERIAS